MAERDDAWLLNLHFEPLHTAHPTLVIKFLWCAFRVNSLYSINMSELLRTSEFDEL